MQSSYPLNQACINALLEQIAKELEAFYAYQSLAAHFEHPDVAMFNVSKYFHAMAAEEVEHAKKFQDYLIMRGIKPTFRDLKAFNPDANLTLQQAFELALRFEQNVFAAVRTIHAAAEEAGDAHLATYLEDEFYAEQMKAEQELSAYLTVIKRLGSGVGEFLFDKDGLVAK
ncbi:hypothetical protein FJ364_00665 [Candidatus Dependentiae bacterium]|nr:hypothetical protein [Candidatus Dependentiae bacterium]